MIAAAGRPWLAAVHDHRNANRKDRRTRQQYGRPARRRGGEDADSENPADRRQGNAVRYRCVMHHQPLEAQRQLGPVTAHGPAGLGKGQEMP